MTSGIWNPSEQARLGQQIDEQEHEMVYDTSCEVRMWDGMWNLEDFCQDYLDLEFDFRKNATGALTMLLPGDSPVRDHLFDNPNGADATIPITVDTPGMQWPGNVDTARLMVDKEGVETIEVTALHHWEYVCRIAMWPSPFAPLIAQFPRRMIVVGPTATVIATYLTTNLLRLQLPLWRIPELGKLFDAASWFNLKNAQFPIAVVPPDLLRDTSKWTALSARMQMGDELFEQALKDAGLVLKAEMFIPGEHPQPSPKNFVLDRPTIVLKIVDKSGVTGPTGTLIDGIIGFFAELLDDGVTEILHPILDPNQENDLGPVSQYLGMKQEKPWVVWLQGQYSGIGESELVVHKPIARDVIVGGKSPGWVNAGIELAIKSLLGLLGQFLMVPGLDALYQGQLSDVFLAFQRFTDSGRAARGGPYMYPEYVDTNGGSAYTIDALVAGRSAVHDTRGYYSHSVTVEDRAPYVFGSPEYGGHFEVGDLVGFEIDGRIYTDYVTQATYKDDRQNRATWTLVIGDGADEEGDGQRAHRKIASLFSIVKDVALDTGADLGLGFI